eukprot:g599.t1
MFGNRIVKNATHVSGRVYSVEKKSASAPTSPHNDLEGRDATVAQKMKESPRMKRTFSESELQAVSSEMYRFVSCVSIYHVRNRKNALILPTKSEPTTILRVKSSENVDLSPENLLGSSETFHLGEHGTIDSCFVVQHWAALLLIDISGFTRLSQALGAEKTKTHCNLYFTRLLRVIRAFKGCTFKFLGDAMLILWILDPNATRTDRANTCRVALECAASVMSVGKYDAVDTQAESDEPYNVSLRLHCGLACGDIHYFRVGHSRRCDDLIGGSCFGQLSKCLEGSKRGEVVVSEELHDLILLHSFGDLSSFFFPRHDLWEFLWSNTVSRENNAENGPSTRDGFSLKRRASQLTNSLSLRRFSLYGGNTSKRVAPKILGSSLTRRRGVSDDEYNSEDDAMSNARLKIAIDRVKTLLPKCTLAVDAADVQLDAYKSFLQHSKKHSNSHQSDVNEKDDTKRRDMDDLTRRNRHRLLQELSRQFQRGTTISRSAEIQFEIRALVPEVTREAFDHDMSHLMASMANVTTLFVNMNFLIKFLDQGSLDMIQRVFTIVLDTLSSEGGVLRQYVRDDKGCVAIGVFGAHSHSFVDNAPRALRAAFTILARLEEETSMKGSVGIATGHAFCGLVGAEHRFEWVVMGPSVNLAARLMGKAAAGHVFIDDQTFRLCRSHAKDFRFNNLAPVNAKGYQQPVPVYEPMRRGTGDVIDQDEESASTLDLFGSERKHPEIEHVSSTLVKRLSSLTIFEKLLLRVAAVISLLEGDSEDSTDSSGEFSLGALTLAMTMLGYGHDVHKIQVALESLIREPAVVVLSSTKTTNDRCSDVDSSSKSNGDRSVSPLMWEASDDVRLAEKETGMKMQGDTLVLVIRALTSHHLFRRMSKAQLTQLAMAMRPMRVAPGEYIFKQGDTTDGYFVLEKGSVSVIVDGHAVKTLGEGRSFGELALLYNTPRSASIVVSQYEPSSSSSPSSKRNEGCSNGGVAVPQRTLTKSVSFFSPRTKRRTSSGANRGGDVKKSQKSGICKLWVLCRKQFLKYVKQTYNFSNDHLASLIYSKLLTTQRENLHSIVASISNGAIPLHSVAFHVIRSNLSPLRKIVALEDVAKRALKNKHHAISAKILWLLVFYAIHGFDTSSKIVDNRRGAALLCFMKEDLGKDVRTMMKRLKYHARRGSFDRSVRTVIPLSVSQSAMCECLLPGHCLQALEFSESFESACAHMSAGNSNGDNYDDANDECSAGQHTGSDEAFNRFARWMLALAWSCVQLHEPRLAFNICSIVLVYLDLPTPKVPVEINSTRSLLFCATQCAFLRPTEKIRRNMSLMPEVVRNIAVDTYRLAHSSLLKIDEVCNVDKVRVETFTECYKHCESLIEACEAELEKESNSHGSKMRVPLYRFLEPHASKTTTSFIDIVDWNTFDIFEFASSNQGPLFSTLFLTLFHDRGFDVLNKINVKIDSLVDSLDEAQRTYENPVGLGTLNFYHNALHGADVMCSAASLITKLESKWLSDGAMTPLVTFAVGISALLHDYRHPGVNAGFLNASSHPLAGKYPTSTLENMHAAETLQLLERHGVLKCFEDISDRVHFRHLVTNLILSTDFSRGLRTVEQIQKMSKKRSRRVLSTYRSNQRAGSVANRSAVAHETETVKANISTVLGLILECSDLAHPAKPLRIHQRWSVMVTQEFYNQGKLERDVGLEVSPMCKAQGEDAKRNFKWSKGQQCFIEYLVQPKYEALSHVCEKSKDTWTAELIGNHAFWGGRSALCHFENLSQDVGKDACFAMALSQCRNKGRSSLREYRPKMTL